MNVKQLVGDIKEQMPDGLNELETLRYLYIYIGKRKNFNPEYYFGNSKTKRQIYMLSNREIENEEFLTEKRNLICTSIASLFKKVAREFSINVETFMEESGNGAHMYNVAHLKDKGTIKLDLQLDLNNIHSNKRTEYFGPITYFWDGLAEEEIEKIDEKIGYKKQGKNYKEDDIKLLINQLKGMNTKDAVNSLLTNEKFLEGLEEEEGYVEALAYVRTTFVGCLNKWKYDTLPYVIHCYRDEDIYKQPLPERQHSMCILNKYKGDYDIYMYRKKQRLFEKVSPERMKKLVEQGLKVDKDSIMGKELLEYIDKATSKEPEL